VNYAVARSGALRAAKSSVLLAETLRLDDHLIQERQLFVSLMRAHEKAEGINALRSKRQPQWHPQQST